MFLAHISRRHQAGAGAGSFYQNYIVFYIPQPLPLIIFVTWTKLQTNPNMRVLRRLFIFFWVSIQGQSWELAVKQKLTKKANIKNSEYASDIPIRKWEEIRGDLGSIWLK